MGTSASSARSGTACLESSGHTAPDHFFTGSDSQETGHGWLGAVSCDVRDQCCCDIINDSGSRSILSQHVRYGPAPSHGVLGVQTQPQHSGGASRLQSTSKQLKTAERPESRYAADEVKHHRHHRYHHDHLHRQVTQV